MEVSSRLRDMAPGERLEIEVKTNQLAKIDDILAKRRASLESSQETRPGRLAMVLRKD